MIGITKYIFNVYTQLSRKETVKLFLLNNNLKIYLFFPSISLPEQQQIKLFFVNYISAVFHSTKSTAVFSVLSVLHDHY